MEELVGEAREVVDQRQLFGVSGEQGKPDAGRLTWATPGCCSSVSLRSWGYIGVRESLGRGRPTRTSRSNDLEVSRLLHSPPPTSTPTPTPTPPYPRRTPEYTQPAAPDDPERPASSLSRTWRGPLPILVGKQPLERQRSRTWTEYAGRTRASPAPKGGAGRSGCRR